MDSERNRRHQSGPEGDGSSIVPTGAALEMPAFALDGGEDRSLEERTDDYRRLMFELFDAQREELISLRNSLEISDEVRRRIERDLDLEESRLDS